MLIWFVLLYLLVSISIGLYAATKVHSAKDYVVAGRSLPLYIVTATVFATRFGSETILGTSASFLQDGLKGIVADPRCQHVPGAGRAVFCTQAVSHEPAYHRRLLSAALWAHSRVAHQPGDCGVLSGMGCGADHCIGIGFFFTHSRQHQHA